MTRSTMLEVLNEDFVAPLGPRGCAIEIVVRRHVLKNALIPVVTIIGLQFGGLLTGAVIVESVFSLSRTWAVDAVTAIESACFPAIQGIVLMAAIVYVIVNLIVDVLYATMIRAFGTSRTCNKVWRATNNP